MTSIVLSVSLCTMRSSPCVRLQSVESCPRAIGEKPFEHYLTGFEPIQVFPGGVSVPGVTDQPRQPGPLADHAPLVALKLSAFWKTRPAVSVSRKLRPWYL
jgi:hypothetical protein